MEVALQENLNYQLELLQFSFLQQAHQQQSVFPVIPSPFFFHNFPMAATEEAVKSERLSPHVDSIAPITISAAAASTIGAYLPQPRAMVVRCDVCELSFFSQGVLQSHMAGSKHQRKVKSAELLKSLESMNHEFERNEISGVIRCIVCDITVNSPQLLATHMAGNKHKANALKRERADDAGSVPPAKRSCPDGAADDVTDGSEILGVAAKKRKKKKKKKSTAETAGN
ncbi:zinc finger protein 385B isoform X2 [Hyalella azteca]|uniref:Zinc finger protein 385B isoform X2 n=1 Tax=Hyalella azteca TaxID=294128 RepID=A0A8B7N5Z1_HYAAZ|nr:zinc finger protein 385B isoform X2 [Hyalella azteca]